MPTSPSNLASIGGQEWKAEWKWVMLQGWMILQKWHRDAGIPLADGLDGLVRGRFAIW
jgi:hypothetical protein